MSSLHHDTVYLLSFPLTFTPSLLSASISFPAVSPSFSRPVPVSAAQHTPREAQGGQEDNNLTSRQHFNLVKAREREESEGKQRVGPAQTASGTSLHPAAPTSSFCPFDKTLEGDGARGKYGKERAKVYLNHG